MRRWWLRATDEDYEMVRQTMAEAEVRVIERYEDGHIELVVTARQITLINLLIMGFTHEGWVVDSQFKENSAPEWIKGFEPGCTHSIPKRMQA